MMVVEKSLQDEIRYAYGLIARGGGVEARTASQSLLTRQPENAEVWLLNGQAHYCCGDYLTARKSVLQSLKLVPDNGHAQFLDSELLIQIGEVRSAHQGLQRIEASCGDDGMFLAKISGLYTQCGNYAAAVRTARLAHKLSPDSTSIRYNLAATLTAIGELSEAETEFNVCIKQTPDDYDAYYNRATLRKQTADHNHVDEIRSALSGSLKHPMGAVQLNYALAKELEDLGQYEQSFAALKRGADARRKMLAYQVSSDTDAMEKIEHIFDENFFSQNHKGFEHEGPVFILGFPRSGTTLVDRILSAHPDVESLGELTDFAQALTGLCKAQNGKTGLIEAAAKLDMGKLGRTYINRTSQRSRGQRFFIDKTPANFLYIGLIAAALPNAKIIHLNRNLADVGYGMYKTLFRMGYPYSYDLSDLATYMRAKEKLMAHWREVLPNKIIDIHYEDIVADQEGQTRKLLESVGLEWNAACLDFRKNKSPSATASAAQVRQPIYKSAVNRWRLYEKQLAPLTDALGITS